MDKYINIHYCYELNIGLRNVRIRFMLFHFFGRLFKDYMNSTNRKTQISEVIFGLTIIMCPTSRTYHKIEFDV